MRCTASSVAPARLPPAASSISTKSDGQPRRAVDTSRLQARFSFAASKGFGEGLRRTIDRYWTHKKSAVDDADPPLRTLDSVKLNGQTYLSEAPHFHCGSQ